MTPPPDEVPEPPDVPLPYLTYPMPMLAPFIGLATWDQETFMPPKAGSARAAQLSTLQGLYHERLVDPALGDWLAGAKAASTGESAHRS